MSTRAEALAGRLRESFGARLAAVSVDRGEVTAVVPAADLAAVATQLRDRSEFAFAQLTDLCGIDYSAWGEADWLTEGATGAAFSRGVRPRAFRDAVPSAASAAERFAAVYHLLSFAHNERLRLRAYAEGEPPTLPTLTSVWASADWYEREAFDLFGIFFDGHPDLRRILTDYGFIGHPFRKDFPLEGHVEVRYDPVRGRVVNQPVSIEARVLVPRVIRHDNRWLIDVPEAAPRA